MTSEIPHIPETILGEELLRLIRELEHDRTLIRISSSADHYEQLATIVGIEDTGECCFRMEVRNGFDLRLGEREIGRLEFTFTARDGFRYRFNTSGICADKGEIRVNFPEVIEKQERRDHLRVKIPPGIMFCFEENNRQYMLNVLNLSRGGVFVEFPLQGKQLPASAVLKYGKTIRNSHLLFPVGGKNTRVRVRKAFVIRSSENTRMEKQGIAIQFTDIGEKEMTVLKEMISEIQRTIFRHG